MPYSSESESQRESFPQKHKKYRKQYYKSKQQAVFLSPQDNISETLTFNRLISQLISIEQNTQLKEKRVQTILMWGVSKNKFITRRFLQRMLFEATLEKDMTTIEYNF